MCVLCTVRMQRSQAILNTRLFIVFSYWQGVRIDERYDLKGSWEGRGGRGGGGGNSGSGDTMKDRDLRHSIDVGTDRGFDMFNQILHDVAFFVRHRIVDYRYVVQRHVT
jgi:hypothetical protein